MAVFGPHGYKDIESSAGAIAIPVPTTTTVYTKAIKLKYLTYFSVFVYPYSASSANVNVTVTVEQSWLPPATEGSADGNYVTPNGMSAIVTNKTTETYYAASLSPIVAPYMRFKIVGSGSNDADTVVYIKLCSQQEA